MTKSKTTPPKTRRCSHCKKEFLSPGNRIFCSNECRRDSIANCAICGQKTVTHRSTLCRSQKCKALRAKQRIAAMRAAGLNPRDGYLPTEEQIRAACAEFQERWTPTEEYEHRVIKNAESEVYLSRFTICGTNRNVDDELR